MIEIAVEMGVQVINTELAGNPNEPEICEELWYRSMEELLPIVEREGIRMEIQSHPWDFCELGNETADLREVAAQRPRQIPLQRAAYLLLRQGAG